MHATILYTTASVIAAFAAGLWGGLNAMHIDWSIFGVAFMCLVPALALVDVATMFATARAARAGRWERRRREKALAFEASVLGLHLVTGMLGVVLLAIPASSALLDGLVLFEARILFLAMAALSVLQALPLPYRLVKALAAGDDD